MVLLRPKPLLVSFGSLALNMSQLNKRRKMTVGTRKKIMDAMNEELSAAGLDSFEDHSRLLDKVTADLVAPYIKVGFLLQTQKDLANMNEPSPKELEQTLANIKGKLRYRFREPLTSSLKDLKRKLPHRPGGGRTPALTPEQKSEACDSVAAHIRQRVPLRDALVRVAQEFTARLGHNVGARTIQRAWRRRGQAC
jgi:hypothetical protein